MRDTIKLLASALSTPTLVAAIADVTDDRRTDRDLMAFMNDLEDALDQRVGSDEVDRLMAAEWTRRDAKATA